MKCIERLYELTEEQLGLLSRDQARGLGATNSDVDHLVQRRGWTPIGRRVIRAPGAPAVRGQTALAAVLDNGGDSVLSHEAAAASWGFPGMTLKSIDVTSTSQTRYRTPLATTHRVRRLPRGFLTRLDSIPIVRPELCILQLCATMHPDRAERAMDNAWNLRLVSGRSLVALIADYGRCGRNGTELYRRLVDARGVDYVPPASGLEGRFEKVISDGGLPEMRRQIDSGGEAWTGRVDYRAIDAPVIAEIQSERHHTALLDSAADKVRIGQLRADGFIVAEIWDSDVWHRPRRVQDQMRDAYSIARRTA